MRFLKELILKCAPDIAAVLVVVAFAYLAVTSVLDKKKIEVKYAELIGTKDKFEKLSAYTAKLESDYEAQKKLAAEADAQWKEVVRSKDAKIELLSDATYLIGKHSNTQHGPDYYFVTPKKTQNLVLNEVRIAGPDSPPIGYVVVKSDGTVYHGNYPFEIEVKNLQVREPATGQVKVYAKAYLRSVDQSFLEKRKPEIKQWKNVDYALPIKDGVAIVDPTIDVQAKHFYFWSPRLVGGFDAGVGAGTWLFKPMLGMSLMGYGYTPRDLDWRLLQFGADVGTDFKNPGINFVPLTYRPFPSILTNTYLGPGIGFDKNGTNYFLNLSLGF